MRISFKCVLNLHVFGIRSSEIACDFRIANEVEMGFGVRNSSYELRIPKSELSGDGPLPVWLLRSTTMYIELLSFQVYMELLNFPVMCMHKHWNSKCLLRKPLNSFDAGIVKKLRKFQYWAKVSY